VCFEYSAPHRCPAAQGIPLGLRARAPVGSTGRCGILFFDYRRQHGLNIKVARIFNTYGPRMQPDDGRVVSNSSCSLLGESRLPFTAMAAKPAHSVTSTI
jgi:hypothetical protein